MNLVKEKGFDPRVFELTESDKETALSFRGTEYKCVIKYGPVHGYGNSRFILSLIPGETKWETRDHAPYWDEDVFNIIAEWLKRVQEEVKTPDPWAALQNSTEFPDVGVADSVKNTPMTYNEWEQVSKGLEGIRTLLLKNSEDKQDADKVINEKIDGLIRDGKTFGRKDFFNQAVGTLMNIMVAVAVQPDVIRGVWELLKGAVSGIITLTPLLVEGGKVIIHQLSK